MEAALQTPLSPASRLCALALGLLLPALALGAERPVVAEIEARTDGRTRTETIIAYSRLDAGDSFGPADEARAARYLDATGLFKAVQIATEPAGPGQVRVIISVTEKHSWVIAPTFAL